MNAGCKLLCEDVLVTPNRLVFVEVTYSKDVVVPKVSRHSLNNLTNGR